MHDWVGGGWHDRWIVVNIGGSWIVRQVYLCQRKRLSGHLRGLILRLNAVCGRVLWRSRSGLRQMWSLDLNVRVDNRARIFVRLVSVATSDGLIRWRLVHLIPLRRRHAVGVGRILLIRIVWNELALRSIVLLHSKRCIGIE